MLKSIKYTVLYVATIILLLHNILPHQHHGEMNVLEHERQHESSNILDILCSIFHLDLGDHLHLKNILLVQNNEQQTEKTIVANVVSENDEPTNQTNFAGSDIYAEVAHAITCEPQLPCFVAMPNYAPLVQHYYKPPTIPLFSGIGQHDLRAPPCLV
jgi:hypothetical protein